MSTTAPEMSDPGDVRFGDRIESGQCSGRVTETPVTDRGRWVIPFCCAVHAVRHLAVRRPDEPVRVLARLPRDMAEVA